MGQPDLAVDERFVDMTSRSENIDEVDRIVDTWTGQHTREDIFRITQENGVICAPVQTIPESLEDKHMLARGSLLKRNNPDIGEISQFQTPIRFKDIAPPEIHDVHDLSQDTNQVLTEMLSLTDADLEVLRSKKVIT